VFDRISGLPAHPLIVHAAVVFLPLLALGAIAYAVVPMLRRHFRWTVAILAVIAPLATVAAKLSGEEFQKNKNLQSAEVKAKIGEHSEFGDTTMWLAIGLGVVALIVVFLVRPIVRTATDAASSGTPVILQVVLGVVTIGVAGATLYYVFRTGDSGAHIVWTGF
jgi:glucan phosphoethanolaminetransferase (alkaline phosphatase superfamily)